MAMGGGMAMLPPRLWRVCGRGIFRTHAISTSTTSSIIPSTSPTGIRCASSKSASSSRYMARQKRDPFVKARQTSGAKTGVAYVARSAFKLEQLDQTYKLLRPGRTVVDLGAAPGGWSQVALRSPCSHVVALDLLPLHQSLSSAPSERLTFLQGDFRSPEIRSQFADLVERQRAKAKRSQRGAGTYVVLSDMMANMSGNTIRDMVASLDLLHAALDFTLHVAGTMGSPVQQQQEGAEAVAGSVTGNGRLLSEGVTKKAGEDGLTLIMKYFESNEAQEFKRKYLQKHFTRVVSKKVAASRSESSEMYFICSGLRRTQS